MAEFFSHWRWLFYARCTGRHSHRNTAVNMITCTSAAVRCPSAVRQPSTNRGNAPAERLFSKKRLSGKIKAISTSHAARNPTVTVLPIRKISAGAYAVKSFMHWPRTPTKKPLSVSLAAAAIGERKHTNSRVRK